MKAWIKKARVILESNASISKVGDKQISFTKKFKESAIKAYKNGKTPDEIFLDAGLDPKIFLRSYCTKAILRWISNVEKHGSEALTIERRGKHSTGRPRSSNKPKEYKTEAAMMARLAYLEAENDFLKKLHALAKKGK